MRLLSFGWSLLNHLYRVCRQKPKSLGVRTFLIGNIEAGGTGKTPLVAALAACLHKKGERVGLLLRGYGGSLRGGARAWFPGSPPPDPKVFGDEAALYASLVPFAAMGVARVRLTGFELIQSFSPTVILMDDGFQSGQIQADATFLLVTDREQVLRRDFNAAARHASCVIALKGLMPESFKAYPWLELQSHFKVVGPDGPLVLVTGVGFPEHVEACLRRERTILKRVFLRDHQSPSLAELASWSREGLLAGTLKDWVKWRAAGYKEEGVVLEMSVSLDPVAGSDHAFRVWREYGFSST